ncbi:hypothetical protein T08_12506 [Trichinella sp. T8]|nr:hypothetical protein T08_12506 [Trichinella sp. T8]
MGTVFIIFTQLNCVFCITKVKFRHKCYYNQQLLLAGKQPIWNSLETAPGWLNFEIGNVFYIIVRYSMKLSSLLQYFFVLGKSIFLHFLSN